MTVDVPHRTGTRMRPVERVDEQTAIWRPVLLDAAAHLGRIQQAFVDCNIAKAPESKMGFGKGWSNR